MTAPYINHSHPLLQVVLGLDNVHASWLDLDHVYREEPLLTWHRERQWMLNEALSSTFVSDSTRIELLKRYGGTYLDLDIITLRPLPSYSNWLGWHAPMQINNAAMNLVKGHPSLQMVASSIPKYFDPTSCCIIGPYLLYDVMHKMCPDDVTNSPNITETDVKCGNVTILARTRLYPFSPYNELDYILQEKKGKALTFFTSQNDTYFLHLYSSHTSKSRVPLGNKTLLGEAAMKNCPKVYNAIVKHGLEL
ncbi:alpha-1,4-N-acetylglucosaminyltransferase-like [Penaeus chinensis]|uniref:alpha-1,4-N-acetylglucosaminyltransferase-like n=1 Tax=Penaeus chinensis TaxID=139456 RepID=UPI001FB663BE|nr:alpha-1,4-N-acetylglucosaminyltransferase-like [Penaeus chinensis]